MVEGFASEEVFGITLKSRPWGSVVARVELRGKDFVTLSQSVFLRRFHLERISVFVSRIEG